MVVKWKLSTNVVLRVLTPAELFISFGYGYTFVCSDT